MSKINKLVASDDKISGRGGLTLVLRYIEQTGFLKMVLDLFSWTTPHKGLDLPAFLKQMLAYFINGEGMSLSDFDRKKQDKGYAAVLESTCEELATSHQIKRFFIKLKENVTQSLWRRVLHKLFIWRLKLTNPSVIILGIDTMVMDNDDALQRENCEPTYKKKKGFQPLHISWGQFLVDVIFRKGSAHSNHGSDYIDSVTQIVKLIRSHKPVPIILVADSGFFDQKSFDAFENDLKIGYVVMGKKYADDKAYLENISDSQYGSYQKNKCVWEYSEYGHKLKSWDKFRRCIYTRLACDEEGQGVFSFAQTDSIIYTNLGLDSEFSQSLKEAGYEHYLKVEAIIKLAHGRGADELIHRSLKEMATKEQLPFKNFEMNTSYYFLLVCCHFLFECFKEDVSKEVLPITAYPNTWRRKLIDIGVKVTTHANRTILHVTRSAYQNLKVDKLWKLCQSPPPISWQ